MFLLDWYQEFISIRQASKSCDSCDTLRSQLDVANFEKQEILKRLLDKEAPTQVETPHSTEFKQSRPKPWAIIRRELEHKSHLEAVALQEKSRALDAAAKPDPTIDDLEKEVLSDANTGTS